MYLQYFPDAKLNVLLSYGLRNSDTAGFLKTHHDRIGDLILDSGAFTLNNAKSQKIKDKITLPGYAAFLKRFGSSFLFAFNYDANFGHDGFYENAENMQFLIEQGNKNIVPVMHAYTCEEADRFITDGNKLVAMGFSPEGKKNRKNIRGFSEYFHEHGVKVHALGATNWKVLADTPVAYADSSSWVQYGKFGTVVFWNDSKAVVTGTGQTDYSECCEAYYFYDDASKPRKSNKVYYDQLPETHPLPQFVEKHLKCDWFDLLNKKATDLRTMLNIHFFQKLQEKVTEHHTNNGWNFD
jgi:hypothetical protein